jgi:hypothetical protein
MLSLVAIIIISILINYFLVTETSFFDGNSVNGTDLEPHLVVLLALDFILGLIVFGVVWLSNGSDFRIATAII